MKLKRNCLFFNAETGDGGRTPDWGHELGQGRGYLMKEDGCSEIINGLVYNQIKDIENFSYGYNRGTFASAMLGLFKNNEFNFFDFLNKLKIQPNRLEDCTSVSQYKLLIEDIYNYKRRGKVNLRY